MAKHECKFDQRVKRKVELSRYEFINGKSYGSKSGTDYLLLWKCKCGAAHAYNLVREVM